MAFVNAQFHTKCAVLKKLPNSNEKIDNSKAFHLVVQGFKKVNSNRNVTFGYEMIGETQPEMGLLEEVAVIYPFSLKTGCSTPSADRI